MEKTMATAIQQQVSANIQEPGRAPEPQVTAWPRWQLISFRVAFLFLLQLTLPLTARWYKSALAVRIWPEFFVLSRSLGVRYISIRSDSGRWGLASFANWGVVLAVALVGAAIWTWFARNSERKEYNALNYWLRLLVRYWVALNIMHYGIIKVFPMQMPFPSLANLHTLFGENAAYHLYWQHVGLSTWYQVVLGTLETTSGMLLLFRRTTAIGAAMNIGLLYNVSHSNFAYDGGVHVLSAEISLLAAFLFLPYIPDLYRLLIKKENVQPAHYRPEFKQPWQRYAFQGAKILAWVLFIPVFVYGDYKQFYYTNYSKEPRTPGLTGSRGYYNVTEFQLNGKDLPYSPLDPVRWHDVVFEDYSTLTYKVNRALPVRVENGSPTYKDINKRYELEGSAGGRVYLHYDVDEANQMLYLQDKNVLMARPNDNGSGTSGSRSRAGGAGRPRRAESVKIAWHYSRPSESRIILSGQDEKNNSIYVVLDRVPEQLPILIKSPVPGEPLQYSPFFGKRYPVHERSYDGFGDPHISYVEDDTP